MSAAPVQFHWNGNMRLAPSYDNNICQTSTASVNITQCNVQPWKQFANTPFGSVWGSWNTTTNTNKTTVQVGTVCTKINYVNNIITYYRQGCGNWSTNPPNPNA